MTSNSKKFYGIFTASLGPALTFGLIQAQAVYIWVRDAIGDGWENMIWMVGGLSFMLGLFFWQRFMRKPGGMNMERGAAAGFLTGLLLHPVFFLVLMPPLLLLNSWGRVNVADLPPALGGLAVASLLSLLLAGLPPLCLCILAGCLWGRAQA